MTTAANGAATMRHGTSIASKNFHRSSPGFSYSPGWKKSGTWKAPKLGSNSSSSPNPNRYAGIE